jgi:hypothetical protein
VSGNNENDRTNNTASDPTTINAASPGYSISGTVSYGIADANQLFPVVSGVNLNAAGTSILSAMSNASGVYQLSNLASGGNYTVTPSKTGDVKGIDSTDATRIQQHLVGMTTLTANQLIAADTDGSGTVNSLDATRIQQRAVGMQTQNVIGQWRFVPASRQYNALGSNQTGQNYQAILVGEVSGNWATAVYFAENSEAKDEEILSTTVAQTAERFAGGNLLTTEISADDLLGRTAEETKRSSDSSADESPTEPLSIAAIPVSLPANASRATGGTVTIPVTVGAIPAGSSIESFDFSVFYNPAVLQPATPAGSNTGTLSANCSVLSNSPVAGRVIVSGSCAQALTTGSGVLYNLTFNVIGAINQTSALSFINPANATDTFQFNNIDPLALTANGLFTVLAPTAANVSVAGRVFTPDGRGLMNAVVNITDANGTTRTTRTGSFGFFRFDNVQAGQTYVLTVNSKSYSFAPQVIMVQDDVTELHFTANGAPE